MTIVFGITLQFLLTDATEQMLAGLLAQEHSWSSIEVLTAPKTSNFDMI